MSYRVVKVGGILNRGFMGIALIMGKLMLRNRLVKMRLVLIISVRSRYRGVKRSLVHDWISERGMLEC